MSLDIFCQETLGFDLSKVVSIIFNAYARLSANASKIKEILSRILESDWKKRMMQTM